MLLACSTPLAIGFLCNCRQVKKNVTMATVHPMVARRSYCRDHMRYLPHQNVCDSLPVGKSTELVVHQPQVKMPDQELKTMLSPRHDTEMPEGKTPSPSLHRSQATFWDLKHNTVMKKNSQQLRLIKKFKNH